MKNNFQKLYELLLNEKPEKADAIVWLQGDRYDRAKKVLEIYKLGFAKLIVISGNNILIGPDTRSGENNIGLSDMKNYLIKNGVTKNDILIDDGALNTKEQAIHIIKLAKLKKWKKIILVSSAYHQPRVFLSFVKQVKKQKWSGMLKNQPLNQDEFAVPDGRKENVKNLILNEIKNIEKYKNDLIDLSEGIKNIENY